MILTISSQEPNDGYQMGKEWATIIKEDRILRGTQSQGASKQSKVACKISLLCHLSPKFYIINNVIKE
jgi:hypothetical protein